MACAFLLTTSSEILHWKENTLLCSFFIHKWGVMPALSLETKQKFAVTSNRDHLRMLCTERQIYVLRNQRFCCFFWYTNCCGKMQSNEAPTNLSVVIITKLRFHFLFWCVYHSDVMMVLWIIQKIIQIGAEVDTYCNCGEVWCEFIIIFPEKYFKAYTSNLFCPKAHVMLCLVTSALIWCDVYLDAKGVHQAHNTSCNTQITATRI